MAYVVLVVATAAVVVVAAAVVGARTSSNMKLCADAPDASCELDVVNVPQKGIAWCPEVVGACEATYKCTVSDVILRIISDRFPDLTCNDAHVLKVGRLGALEQRQRDRSAGVGLCDVEGRANGNVVEVRVGEAERLGDAAWRGEEEGCELHTSGTG